ncbi:hypothetical protein EC973_004149, partial [Apophysomyces ossiformis]
MILKAVLLLTASFAYITILIPPKYSRRSEKTDLLKTEDAVLAQQLHPYALVVCNVAMTALYLASLTRRSPPFLKDGEERKDFADAIVQLQVLKPWHIIMAFVSIFGCALRRAAFAALGRYFT